MNVSMLSQDINNFFFFIMRHIYLHVLKYVAGHVYADLKINKYKII